jgi:two-component system, NtrC family, response regulator
MEKPKILITDDDDELRTQMKWSLATDYEVLLAEDRLSAIEVLKRDRPAIATLDLGLPPFPGSAEEGLRTLAEWLQIDPLIKVIVITGQGEKSNALLAIAQGAYDFFAKPVDMEILKVLLGRALYVSRLERENHDLQQRFRFESFERMVGTSSKMLTVFETMRKVAPTNAPVLVIGESGTGKELAAQAIHRLSARKDGPFVPINCGAIPETLLESELFGHEKGSFTGAHIQRQGRIEAAQGGTLFLDEIGELSPSLQVKLLRFLQEQQIERIGGRKPIQVDVRVICATNTDLQKAMAEGRFREDLYYRIGVVLITLPPLREREGDVLLLAKALLQKLAQEQKKMLTFSRKAMEVMEIYSWPGNIREMENRLRRAVIMIEGTQITPSDLEINGYDEADQSVGLAQAREAVERQMVEKALMRNRGNLSKSAEELKISRPTLYELIQKLGINRTL